MRQSIRLSEVCTDHLGGWLDGSLLVEALQTNELCNS